jgi:AraC-like DNA-binding protein
MRAPRQPYAGFMIRTFRVSGFLLRRLDELGVPPAAVLRQACLPLEFIGQDQLHLTTAQLFAFWQAIGEVCENPAIGLELGSEDRIERYDAIAIAALYARCGGDALARMARYKALTCPEEVRLISDDEARIVQFIWPEATSLEPATLTDVCFSWVVTIMRRGTGQRLCPRRIEFARDMPSTAMYERWFGCPVQAEASRNALIFAESDLAHAFITYHPELLGMVSSQLDAELSASAFKVKTTHDEVKLALRRLLAGQRPSMRDVARELGLSGRTLQRRLADDGVSFQQVLADTRRELARHYLRQPAVDLSETAYLLGYDDPNSFFRAFHHWEGTSPGQWRALNSDARTLKEAG